ncbi:MAG TPA: hypothetical protein PKA42_02740, partial [Candidatus Paceibacterota bacterium]|nr:hypothetical protein [Candidatus Paceibacterota bacterium]
YDAYIAFMNALSDLQLRVSHALLVQTERTAERALKKAAAAEKIPEILPVVLSVEKEIIKQKREGWFKRGIDHIRSLVAWGSQSKFLSSFYAKKNIDDKKSSRQKSTQKNHKKR